MLRSVFWLRLTCACFAGEGGWVSCFGVGDSACISRLAAIKDGRVHGVSQQTSQPPRAPPVGAGGTPGPGCKHGEDISSPQPHSLAVYGGRYLCLVSLDVKGR